MAITEIQVDRIVGPTHHFGGLGVGNVASAEHAGHVANPAAAALQGLDKMRLVASLGTPQWILPPQRRPAFEFLQSCGFGNGDRAMTTSVLADTLRDASSVDPVLLSAAMSCSSMWTANAATLAPGIDRPDDLDLGHAGQVSDGRRRRPTTLVVANLSGSLHRAIEPQETVAELRHLLAMAVEVLDPLCGGAAMRDEGAANHMRLSPDRDSPGIHVFVYGDTEPRPAQFWPRQTRRACEAVARRLRIDRRDCFFLKQSARAVDAGAFHNDVVAASHDDLLLYHQHAFEDPGQVREIGDAFRLRFGKPMRTVEVSEQELSLGDAVATYLFNSQIIASADRQTAPMLICPSNVSGHPPSAAIVRRWLQEGIFSRAETVDLAQSMSGGGGPACLRLRVPLEEDAISLLPTESRWSPPLDADLRELIESHYPTRSRFETLADAEWVGKCQHATTLLRRRLGFAGFDDDA